MATTRTRAADDYAPADAAANVVDEELPGAAAHLRRGIKEGAAAEQKKKKLAALPRGK